MPADTEALPTTPPTVRARHAASVVVWQKSDDIEILMGMRGARHRFMPNRLVFPGGAVDPIDTTPLSPETRSALERAANPTLAQALAVAAARELEEETGLTLGRPPNLDGLSYLCRAVTPPSQPIRFNARFLAVSVSCVSGAIAGSGELEELRYYTLGELHAFDLAWITREVLNVFERWLPLSDDERRVRTAFPVCRRQRWSSE
jgi:8-oxo-dGTP pyrophosphatase MutT (NUDIX family)